MNARYVVLAIVLLVMVLAVNAFPLAMEYPKGKIYDHKEFPVVNELMNRPERVYGYLVNSADYFYYAGDTDAFNSFLKEYSKLDIPSHVLELHNDNGSVKNFEKKKIDFDWSMSLDEWGAIPGPGRPEIIPTAKLDLWLPRLASNPKIKLDKIVVPDNIEFKAINEMDSPLPAFVAKHRSARAKIFGIFLLADNNQTIKFGSELEVLKEYKLQEEPLITIDDVVSYSPKDYKLVHTEEGARTIPNVAAMGPDGKFGIPFIVVAGGERIYMGRFISQQPSTRLIDTPTIYTDHDMTGADNSFVIDFQPTTTTPDPRNDREIIKTLNSEGKLK